MCDSPCSPLLGFPPLPPGGFTGIHHGGLTGGEPGHSVGAGMLVNTAAQRWESVLELSMSPKSRGAKDPTHTEEIRK